MKLNLTICFLAILMYCSSCKTNADVSTQETETEISTASNDVPPETEPTSTVEFPQNTPLWKQCQESEISALPKRITPSKYTLYCSSYVELTKQLDVDNPSISLPTLTGMETFNLQNANTMSESLAAKFPNIRSFKGTNDKGDLNLRLDTNDEGLFAEITGIERKELIAPLVEGNTTYYALYLESDLEGGTPRDKTFD